jgi:hypothetical protein
VHRDLLGTSPSSAVLSRWVGDIDGDRATLADLAADLAPQRACVDRWRQEVNVLMSYAGLLRRRPDDGGWAYWVPAVEAGTSIERLIAQFMGATEYRNRFA